MAKFVTYIADPELEYNVIKAIAAIKGELAIRGVSIDQVREAEKTPDVTLVCTRQIDFAFRRVIVDKSMTTSEISEILSPENQQPQIAFDSGGAKVACFVGLSGGVGTTTLAINYAFEKSQISNVILADMDGKNPDIARALGLHRIEGRNEKISKSLFASQGIPAPMQCDKYVFDIGSNLHHPLLEKADEIYLVSRIGFNTLARLQELDLVPTTLVVNFSDRTKAQLKWLGQIEEVFPRLNILRVPFDNKAFESAAESRSALIEIAANSLARKSIATLG
jgi:Flp pilus assembly CpaE family ATPase